VFRLQIKILILNVFYNKFLRSEMITIIIKTVDKLKINMEDKHGFFKKIWKIKEYKE
jgi:hypothetical protein